jgi:hypothetical protein
VEAETPRPPPKAPETLTAGQLDYIRALLGRNRWNWLDVKDVLEFEVGVPLPDDPSQLGKETASKVIDALRSWERKPTKEELGEAEKLLRLIPEEVAKRLNLPEKRSEVRGYHIALLNYAWARTELEKTKKGGEAK